MNFNNNLHEDLFDLFIMSTMGVNVSTLEDEFWFGIIKVHGRFEYFKDLFPQENAPIVYERWVSEHGLWSLMDDKGPSVISHYHDESYPNKILISIEGEE